MSPVLFLHSEVPDPYKIYHTMLAEQPVYWDDSARLWAVYSYESCQALLHSEEAHIPVINPGNLHGLNEYALLISSQLTRLHNDREHIVSRHVVKQLVGQMKRIVIGELVETLMNVNPAGLTIDWVRICKQLPVLAVLQSLAFTEKDSSFILNHIETLVKLMLPVKTPEQVSAINTISKELYFLVAAHVIDNAQFDLAIQVTAATFGIPPNTTFSLFASNCIGLFIQSYDAGRGLLSNSLLQLLKNNCNSTDKTTISKSVIETLRFNPPIHNTRRRAARDILLNPTVIKEGEMILLVLAAANRDPGQFDQPDIYNIERGNNKDHLTFGAGVHQCIASHFAVNLAVESLSYLFNRYKSIQLADQTIQYEPLVNARLPQQLLITLS